MVSQNLSKLTTICLGNAFSVYVTINAWEQKFVYCSIDNRFAMRLEAKGIPSLCYEILTRPITVNPKTTIWVWYNSNTSWNYFHSDSGKSKSMHVVNTNEQKRNTINVYTTRGTNFFLIPLEKVSDTAYFLFLEEFLTRFLLYHTAAFLHLSLNVPLVKQIAEF